jgi:hypothetical protein
VVVTGLAGSWSEGFLAIAGFEITVSTLFFSPIALGVPETGQPVREPTREPTVRGRTIERARPTPTERNPAGETSEPARRVEPIDTTNENGELWEGREIEA